MRKTLFIVFEALYLISLLGNITKFNLWGLLQTIAAAISLYSTNNLINKILSSNSSDSLTPAEKKIVLITTFLNPIVSGAFYHYALKNKYPQKASQANKYAWLMFALWVLITVIIILLILPSIRAPR